MPVVEKTRLCAFMPTNRPGSVKVGMEDSAVEVPCPQGTRQVETRRRRRHEFKDRAVMGGRWKVVSSALAPHHRP